MQVKTIGWRWDWAMLGVSYPYVVGCGGIDDEIIGCVRGMWVSKVLWLVVGGEMGLVMMWWVHGWVVAVVVKLGRVMDERKGWVQ